MVAAGSASGKQVIMGYTADEWRLFRFSLPAELQAPLDLASIFDSSEEAYATYAATRANATDRDVYAAVESDLLFTIPVIRLAEAQLHHTSQVWIYRFDWSSPVLGGILGAFHSLDVPFTFERYDDPVLLGNNPPDQLGDDLHHAWIRFATNGDPNGGTLPHWPCYDLHQRQVLLLNTPCEVVEDPRAAIRQLWEHVPH